MKLLAKFHRYERILIVLLIKIITIALAEVVKNHNDQFHPNNQRLLYNQPNKNYNQKRELLTTASQDGDPYHGQSNNHNSNHHHQSYDDSEYSAGYPRVADATDDRLIENLQPNKHQDYDPVSSAFGESALPDNISASDTTHHVNSMDASDQYENNLSDKTFLSRELTERTCRLDRGSQRSEQLNGTYLTYCSRYKLENLLSNEILMSIMHHDSRDCERILGEFIQLDETINQFDNLFMTLLSRYNCHNGYSVKWNCDDCKKAYKDWLCATHLPFYMNGERIKPCISFCERVEQRCPYLHPITREQYGGQPVFICRDPNIPFVPEITPDIPYSEPGKCYDLCHLSDNLTELIIDSLSKYDYDKCPEKGAIAGEVRSEQALNIPLSNDSRFITPSTTDSMDYPDQYDENAVIIANRTNSAGQAKVPIGHSEHKKTHVHNKKLEELREVLANYKNQAKTHRYHADHSSIEQSKSHMETH